SVQSIDHSPFNCISRRCPKAYLRLRGGTDGVSGFEPNPSPSIPSYTSPASQQVDWDTPSAQSYNIPPAPVAEMDPPPAFSSPPKAPVPSFSPPVAAPSFSAPPAPAPAPTQSSVSWDETSVSGFRRFIDMFGWQNISPFLYFAMGAFWASIMAIWHNTTPDEDLDMKAV
ncbi:hypothetical protein GUITHDRAFT_152807, partial [Guillardia theta CCMP2712]